MDFDLQMRFWRGVTDAMFHSADAAFAAAAAWQDDMLSRAESAGRGSSRPTSSASSGLPAAVMWPWWPADSNPWMSAMAAPAPVTAFSHMPMAFSAMMPFANDFLRAFGSSMAPASWPAAGFYFNPWPMPWATMHLPLTMMMVSLGVPYAVASPSAKASAAAMDAADAARQQMEKVYSSYRSDGGHAAQLSTVPWTMAASFVGVDPATGVGSRSW